MINTQSEAFCPLEGTQLEGFCVENFAVIRAKPGKCEHTEYCTQLKKELEEAVDN